MSRKEETAQERRFRAAFDQAAVGMAEVGLDGRWLRVNQKLCEMVGYTSEELTRFSFQDIAYPGGPVSDLGGPLHELEGRLDTYSMETRLRGKDGTLVRINLTVSLVRGPSGEPDYFFAVIEDFGRRRVGEAEREALLARLKSVNEELVLANLHSHDQAEEARRRAAELDTTIMSIPDGVMIYDPSGRVTRLNPAARDMLGPLQGGNGISPEEWATLLGPESPEGEPLPAQALPVSRALRGETVLGDVMVIHLPGGRRVWASVSAAPIPGPGDRVQGVIVTVTDITPLH